MINRNMRVRENVTMSTNKTDNKKKAEQVSKQKEYYFACDCFAFIFDNNIAVSYFWDF